MTWEFHVDGIEETSRISRADRSSTVFRAITIRIENIKYVRSSDRHQWPERWYR